MCIRVVCPPLRRMNTSEKVEEDKCNYERYRSVVINLAQGGEQAMVGDKVAGACGVSCSCSSHLSVVSEADALAKIDVDETLPILPFASEFHHEKKK